MSDLRLGKRERAKRYLSLQRVLKELDCEQGLNWCAAASRKLFQDNKIWHYDSRFSLTPWFTSFLAKEIIMNSPISGGKEFSDEEFERLSRDYAVLSCADHDACEYRSNGEEISAELQIQYERVLYAHEVWSLLPRVYLTLLDPVSPKVAELSKRYSNAFEQIYGMSALDYFRVCFGLQFCLSRVDHIDKNLILNTPDSYFDGWFTEENIAHVESHISSDFDDFKSEQLKVGTLDFAEKLYEFNYLFSRPLVYYSDGTLRCPSYTLFSHRITSGIFFDLIDHFDEADSKSLSFRTDFGKLFENHVGYLIEREVPSIKTIQHGDEFAHLESKSAMSSTCDWVIFEDKSVILIECKSGRLPVAICMKGDLLRLRQFLTSQYLNRGKTQFQMLYDHFTAMGKMVYCLVVYNDQITMYNKYNSIFDQQDPVLGQLNRMKVQFLNIWEFETLITASKDDSMSSIIMRKVSTESSYTSSFTEFASSSGIYKGKKRIECYLRVWRDIFGEVPE